MNIDKNFRTYLVVGAILVIVFIILLFVPGVKKEETKITPTGLPTPTIFAINPSGQVASPTLIPAVNFTGAIDATLPKEMSDLVKQKNSLIDKTPLQGNYFTITFSYKTDKFSVQLKEPKTDSQQKFEQWLKTNYPAVPIDRFIIN